MRPKKLLYFSQCSNYMSLRAIREAKVEPKIELNLGCGGQKRHVEAGDEAKGGWICRLSRENTQNKSSKLS